MPKSALLEELANELPIRTTMFGDEVMEGQALDDAGAVWDTVRLNVGEAVASRFPLKFFEIPRGRAGSGFSYAKSYVETNLESRGLLGKDRELTVRNVKVSVMPVGAAPAGDGLLSWVAQLIEDSWMVFRADTAEELVHVPIYLGGYGLVGTPQPNSALTQGYVSGSPLIKATRNLTRTVGLKGTTPFDLGFNVNPNSTPLAAAIPDDVLIRVYLIGSSMRPPL